MGCLLFKYSVFVIVVVVFDVLVECVCNGGNICGGLGCRCEDVGVCMVGGF